MKNKILLALAVLVLVFSLTGCKVHEEKDFVGTWVYFGVYYYILNSDGTWLSGFLGVENYDSGTWTWNGDDTVTLVNTAGKPTLATIGCAKEYDWEEDYKEYLLIDSEKYWEHKKKYHY